MAKRAKPKNPRFAGGRGDRPPLAGLRIIGGLFRGRKLKYSGDELTRPMKDRVREAVFNLVQSDVKGRQAIDLFAGTGALGLEAMSRGAERAVLIERHHPTAAIIRENARLLGVEDRAQVVVGDAFAWSRQPRGLTEIPWLVFCSPPYALYVDRLGEMLDLVTRLLDRAPEGSALVVESDKQFDMSLLPQADTWDVRSYPPAMVGVFRKREPEID